MGEAQPPPVDVDAEPKRLHPLVFLAIYSAPIVFVWLLLRRGYSHDVRLGGFLLAFVFNVAPMVAAFADPTFNVP